MKSTLARSFSRSGKNSWNDGADELSAANKSPVGVTWLGSRLPWARETVINGCFSHKRFGNEYMRTVLTSNTFKSSFPGNSVVAETRTA